MNSLTIDLVPKGEFTIKQEETGIELIFSCGKGKSKVLGSMKTDSLLFLNDFLSACMTTAVEKSKPPEPNYQEWLEKMMKMFKMMNPPDEEGKE